VFDGIDDMNQVAITEMFPNQDLAHIVGSQQEQIDHVETHMENASRNAEEGLKQIEKAKIAASESTCIIS
jgi:t-SNARE complex subunit (syntaxin)